MSPKKKRGPSAISPTEFPVDYLWSLLPTLPQLLAEWGAPKTWSEVEVRFLLECAYVPTLHLKLSTLPEVFQDRDVQQSESQKKALCLKLAQLFAESPDAFLNVMTKLRRLIKKRFESPVFVVMAQILFSSAVNTDLRHFFWTEPARKVAAYFNDDPYRGTLLVTPKCVEKARARMRKIRAPETPPESN